MRIPAVPTDLDLIEKLYLSFESKDYETFRQLCSPDIEWHQNPGFPGGGTWRGPDEIIDRVFSSFGLEWERWGFTIEEMLETERTVVVLGYYEGVHRQTGWAFRAEAAHVYNLREGKVVRFRQYADTKAIWDAMVPQ